MQAFMWQEHPIGMASFVNACLNNMGGLNLTHILSHEGRASGQPDVAGRHARQSDQHRPQSKIAEEISPLRGLSMLP